MAENTKSRRKAGKIALIVILCILAACAAAWFGAARFFKDHYYPRTSINGQDISLKDEAAGEELLKKQAEDYVLAVHDRDGRVSYFNAGDFDYTYDSDGTARRLLDGQDSLLWPRYIFQQHEYSADLPVKWDEKKLEALISAMDCFKEENITKPKNAYIEDTDKGWEIIPEVEGNQPIKEQVIADIKKAVAARTAVLELGSQDYTAPTIRSDDPTLQAKMETADKFRRMTITYKVPGGTRKLDGDTISSWLSFDKDGNVTVDEGKVADYAQQLAYTYNTYGDKRQFKTTKGDTITIGGGDYGWIVDKAAEAKQLKADIEKGESVEREPCWEQKAFTDTEDDIGKTYIEVDYSSQHMWYYKNGSLVLDADIVTGNNSIGNGSPDGVFKVISRIRDTTLQGEDYSSPVQYFMPFAYNVGFHDASWRSSFGGSIYLSSCSHGCVNMPADKAKQLFDSVEPGTPVIAFYRDPVTLSNTSGRVSNAYSYKAQ